MSHTQFAPVHRWPAAQAAPPPQAQAPVSVQESAVVSEHATHAEPAAPHCCSERAMHALFLQQPFGHEVASQTHCPPAHFWPAAHAAPVPHAQPPALEQPSALVASQPTHKAPLVPHLDTDDG